MNDNTETPFPNIPGLIAALARLSEFDKTIQLSTALTLLYVARHQNTEGGVSTGDIGKWVGITPAAASRNSYYWAEGTDDMPQGGRQLITVAPDPRDRRRRVTQLTLDGETVVRELNALL
ncbi:MAG: hypothetical protein AAGF74_01810 [Pseudomonadota bacterium]